MLNVFQYYPTKYEGYWVNALGSIISYRTKNSKSPIRIDYSKPRFMSYKTDKDGYSEVTFSVDKKRYTKKVHQVVAETFLGDAPEGYVVDHINHFRKDNRLENLHYVPASANTGRRYRKQFIKPSSAKKCVYNGKTYLSIADACKVAGIKPRRLYGTDSDKYVRRFVDSEGVETIEIIGSNQEKVE